MSTRDAQEVMIFLMTSFFHLEIADTLYGMFYDLILSKQAIRDATMYDLNPEIWLIHPAQNKD